MNIAERYNSVDKFIILNISEATIKDTYQKILTLQVKDWEANNESKNKILVYPDTMENRKKFLDYYRNRVILMVKLDEFKKESHYHEGVGICDNFYHPAVV